MDCLRKEQHEVDRALKGEERNQLGIGVQIHTCISMTIGVTSSYITTMDLYCYSFVSRFQARLKHEASNEELKGGKFSQLGRIGIQKNNAQNHGEALMYMIQTELEMT